MNQSENDNSNCNKELYGQQEKRLSAQSIAFFQMLEKKGIIENIRIDDDKIRKAEKEHTRKMYHNTQLMLQNYRNITWALSCFPAQISMELAQPLYDLEHLVNLVNNELDIMENNRLEHRLQGISHSKALLDRINEALSVLKNKPGNGKLMYDIIYQTYIIPDKLSHMEILNQLNISTRHYYRLRQQAINILSIRLWSAPSVELEAWLEILTLIENV